MKLKQSKHTWRKPRGLQTLNERTRSLAAQGGTLGGGCPPALPHLPAFLLPLPCWVHQHTQLSQQCRGKLNAAVVVFLPPQVNVRLHPMWDQRHINAAQTQSVGQVARFLHSQDPAATLNFPLQAHTVEKSRTTLEGFPLSKALVISVF